MYCDFRRNSSEANLGQRQNNSNRWPALPLRAAKSLKVSVALPKSPTNLAQGDEVPQIITLITRQRPSEILHLLQNDFCNTIGTFWTCIACPSMSAAGGKAECAGRPARSRWCKSITMKE